ncbi:ABC transporter permease [Nocardiopsis metallicus]|uniref:Heme exporter protein D n=1 Tax=Nocardiopsis metallicus TaxID=179819 RepID=A0A840WC69_9ACTN|nr:ABC transporter permease [Nocardiopsis metallicus]MBB5490621.1 heme exporter protein D [Nocardiopsis metallicus]
MSQPYGAYGATGQPPTRHPPPAGRGERPEGPPPTPLPEAFQSTPHTERYVLQADALRRRQLRAAILYGSSRYWRRRHHVWPSVVVGLIAAAVLAAGIVVANAFQVQQELNEQRQQEQTQDPSTPLIPQERTTAGPGGPP